MTANYFRTLAARCRTASRDPFDLFAKEEFRRLPTTGQRLRWFRRRAFCAQATQYR